MTQLTAPLVGDLANEMGHTPRATLVPRRLADALGARVGRVGRWLRPVGDLVGAAAALALLLVLGLGLTPAVGLGLVLGWPVVLGALGRYQARPFGERLATRTGRVVRAGAVVGLACWLLNPLVGSPTDPATVVPATLAITVSALATTLVRRVRPAVTRLVVVGHPVDAQIAVLELGTCPQYDVAAVCVSEPPMADDAPMPLHVGVADAVEIALEAGATTLLAVPGPDLTTTELRRLLWRAAEAGIHVFVGTGLLDVAPARMSLAQGGGLDLLHVRPSPHRGPRRLLKGVSDRVLAATALLLLAPVLLAVAVLVRRDSAGPAIFRQTRVGKHGRTFTMYKFRTMTTQAEADRARLAERNECDDVLFKVKADPRITRLGAVLRRYSVDEVPQLLNVLLGQMSLVGPRPALPDEVDRYTVDPRRRLDVKPGLTGLWQVSGRSDLSWAESVRLDVRYVDNWSLGLDVAILCRTVGAVVGHRGAY